MFENIPDELKELDQWVMWRYEDRQGPKPTKPPYCLTTGKRANVNDREDWNSYQACLQGLATGWYDGIGFVLTDEDPYALIDLDSTHGDVELVARQVKIYEEFPSYAEVSPSKDGLHIIVKGKIPAGRKRSAIEIYSSGRFMAMTGDVYRNLPIADCSELLTALWARMEVTNRGNKVVGDSGLIEGQVDSGNEILTDDQVVSMAMSASNGEKFNALFAGSWEQYYPSQSEADFALINMFAFYSHNRKQVVRLFLQSGLGQRDKAKREDYLGWMLNRCFDRLLPLIDIQELRSKLIELVEMANAVSVSVVDDMGKACDGQIYDFAQLMPTKGEMVQPPKGLVGDVMRYMFASSPRPVEEVAVTGALGLFAGIVGRSYNVSNAGLNMYWLLIASTGLGKEAARGRGAVLMEHIKKNVPSASDFIGPGQIASAQGVLRYMSNGKHSFVANIGEIGHFLKDMNSSNQNPALAGIRRMLLDIYGKSSHGDVMGSTVYSDAAKNTNTILAPAFSLLGESTHAKFYESLSDDMITEGLLPRFCIVEVEPTRKRSKLNKAHGDVRPSEPLIRGMSDLCQHSYILNQQNKAVCVGMDAQAEWLFDQFNLYCDAKVDGDGRDVSQSLWTRSYLKAMKLAATLAVGNNIYSPVIDETMAKWAIIIVLQDVQNLLTRFNMGEIGSSDNEGRQLHQLIDAIAKFMTSSWSEVKSYLDDNQLRMHSEKIVPFRYLQRKMYMLSSYRNDRIGANMALARAIRTLLDRGDIDEIEKPNMLKYYGTRSRGFAAKSMSLFQVK